VTEVIHEFVMRREDRKTGRQEEGERRSR